MGRKNKRSRTAYRQSLGFNPRRYISSYQVGASYDRHDRYNPYDRFSRNPLRGDIWFADLGEHPGTSVQGGCRPVMVISNDVGNIHAETINVLPMTRHLKKPNLPCHTQIQPEQVSDVHQALDASMILAEQITTISKTQLRNYAGKVDDHEFMNIIDQAVSQQLGLEETNPTTQSTAVIAAPTTEQKEKE